MGEFKIFAERVEGNFYGEPFDVSRMRKASEKRKFS